MNLEENVIPVSYYKAHASEIIERVASGRKPVVITQKGRARVIVQDLRTYHENEESMALLKLIAQGKRDVALGKVEPLKKAFQDLRKPLRPAAAP